MKNLIAAIVIICLIVSATAWVCAHSNRAADELLGLSDALELVSASEQFPLLLKSWERHRTFFSVTINSTQIYEVDLSLSLLRAAIENEDSSLFCKGKSTLMESLKRIKSASSFSLDELL